MKNCGGDPLTLQELIENIPKKVQSLGVNLLQKSQDVHTSCPKSSPCQFPRYTPGKTTLTDPNTTGDEAILKTRFYSSSNSFHFLGRLKSKITYISFCRVCDGYMIISL